MDTVAPDSSGMLVESFFEDEELARTALSCQLPMDLLCHESHVAWQSAACQKVGNAVLKLLCMEIPQLHVDKVVDVPVCRW